MKHTPGPWVVKSDRTSIQVYPADDVAICELWRRSNPELEMANARLIAAAPDLLEALEMLAAVDFGANGSVERGARLARIAIAKARGGKWDSPQAQKVRQLREKAEQMEIALKVISIWAEHPDTTLEEIRQKALEGLGK